MVLQGNTHLRAGISKSNSEKATDLVDAALQNPGFHLCLSLPLFSAKLSTLHHIHTSSVPLPG